MKTVFERGWMILALVFASVLALADEGPTSDAGVRILSWNIQGDAYVTEPAGFESLLRWADPDVVLLDEVDPSPDIQLLQKAFTALRPNESEPWHINVGASGGRQRQVIASRSPQEAVPEFSSIIPYPDADQSFIWEQMSDLHRSFTDFSMDHGIPVNAAVLLSNGRRLLIVVVDLQCCGSGADHWTEYRRQVEARGIRRRIEQVLERTTVDSLIIAGDFNQIHGSAAADILKAPFGNCPQYLGAAELYHHGSDANWTWDGRGEPFPSAVLDFQFYCSGSLEMRSGFIVDSDDLSPEARRQHGLDTDTSKSLGQHRPLLAEYGWK